MPNTENYSAEYADQQTDRRLAELFGPEAVRVMIERAIPIRAAANAVDHVQAQLDHDGGRYVIGWGDAHRRLPLILAHEAADGPVTDVTAPNMSDPTHRALVALLVVAETAWALEREAQPRDIAGALEGRSVADIALHGIPGYHPHTPYAHTDGDEVLSFWRVDRPSWPTAR